MAEKSPKAEKPEPQLPLTVHEIIASEEEKDARWTRWSIGFALAAHLVMFVVQWPDLADARTEGKQERQQIFVVKQFKFKQPPKQELPQIVKPRVQKVPIPDPTPDEPEPLQHDEPEIDVDYIDDDTLVWGPVEAPPPPEPTGPVRFVVGGDITRPEKLHAPPPLYPEAARRARITGAVIIECLIDRNGTVRETTVLKGLPLGVTEAALDAVAKWRFKPSTLNGNPVEVIYMLTVNFNLQ
jgi:TonB family protein